MPADFDVQIKRYHPIIFGLLIFFSFIEFIQTAVLVSDYNMGGAPSDSLRDQSKFLLFVSLWTLFFSIFYVVGFMKATGSFLMSIASHFSWFFVTWLFWLAGAGAITNSLGSSPLNCANVSLVHCHLSNSVEAFAWILWLISTVGLIAVGVAGARSARGGSGFGGPMTSV